MLLVIPPHRLWMAAIVSVAFAAFARSIRGVSASGALAGVVVCFLLYAGAGPGALLALVTVFALAWTTTRWEYQRKKVLGAAEKHDGRSASQVLANLGAAAACAVCYALSGKAAFLLAMAAALSEAAADTVSSEVGQARNTRAWLITTWQPVPAGTDGGISLSGTTAGVCAAVVVSAVCAAASVLPWTWLGFSVGAAFFGTIADSLLGATIERRGWLGNDAVNFLSTLIAAVLAWAGASRLGL